MHEPLQGFSRGFSINAYFLRGDEKPPSCSTAFPQIGIRTQMSYIAQGLMVFEKIEKNGDKNNVGKHTCSSVYNEKSDVDGGYRGRSRPGAIIILRLSHRIQKKKKK